MTFSELASYFSKLENTSSRNSMTEILSVLFHKSTVADIGKISYLLQGRVVPLYEPLEFGMGDKMVVRAISMAMDIENKNVVAVFKQTGDLGITVERLKNKDLKFKNPEINDVYEKLFQLVKTSGEGSQEGKTKILSDLIGETNPLSAKYIVKIVLAKLRMGFSDMTILDALSWMLTGSKKEKKVLENAYNVRPDLGYIAQTAKKTGIKGLLNAVPVPGTPIRMAKADRLTSSQDIFEKIGACAVEFKYDGLRLQVHKKGKKIHMYSRNLEDITPMFPDIEEAVRKQINCDSVIFEGEICAYDPKTGASVPFQETMQRKRKYDIAKKALEIPVKLYAFDLLYADNTNYINKGYIERKNKLKQILKKGKTIIYAEEKIISDADQIDDIFELSIKENYEGIIAKKLDGIYEAGVRGWNWIKYKKAMNKKISDTVDVLVMGMTLGEGKRTSFGVGQFLTGVLDRKNDKFVTITKIGTGLTDDQFREFAKRVEKLKIKEKPNNYDVDKLLYPDFWLKQHLVVEISGDIITRTSVHTAGREMELTKSGRGMTVKSKGYALRFPRLERFRDDKGPMDVTTLEEIQELFKKQK